MALSTAPEDKEDLRNFSHTREWLGSYMVPCRPRIIPRQRFASSANRPPTVNSLQKLPTELIFEVLSYLDLKSLTDLRAVDFWAKDLVDVFPAYEHLLRYAPEAVQALSDTRLIASFTASTLHEALRSDTCIGCDDFGPFILLPLGKRCCFNCLQDNLLLRVITVPAARKCFDLSKKTVDALPKLLNLPGNYGPEERQIKSRKNLVSVWEARERAIEQHGGRDEMEAAVLSNTVKEQTTFELKMARWEESRSLCRRPSRPKSPREIVEAPNDPFQFLASAPFPLLHRDGTLEHGLSCLGCQDYKANDGHKPTASFSDFYLELERWDLKSYTERGILQHFKQCTGMRIIKAMDSNSKGPIAPLQDLLHLSGP